MKRKNHPIYEKVTGKLLGYKDINYPISIEFDNSAALSERADCVYWNDEDGLVAGISFNNSQVRGELPALGHAKPINAGYIFMADYGEIQQMRMVVDQDGAEQFMDALMENGNFMANIDCVDVPVNEKCKQHMVEIIFHQTNPIASIKPPGEQWQK